MYKIDDFTYLLRSRFYQIYHIFFLIKSIKQASPVLHASGEGVYNTTTDLPTGSEPRSTVFSCNASLSVPASCAVKIPLNMPHPMYICAVNLRPDYNYY